MLLILSRMWDARNGSTVNALDLDSPATSIELSRDRDLLTVAHGNTVSFIDASRWVGLAIIVFLFYLHTCTLYVICTLLLP